MPRRTVPRRHSHKSIPTSALCLFSAARGLVVDLHTSIVKWNESNGVLIRTALNIRAECQTERLALARPTHSTAVYFVNAFSLPRASPRSPGAHMVRAWRRTDEQRLRQNLCPPSPSPAATSETAEEFPNQQVQFDGNVKVKRKVIEWARAEAYSLLRALSNVTASVSVNPTTFKPKTKTPSDVTPKKIELIWFEQKRKRVECNK